MISYVFVSNLAFFTARTNLLYVEGFASENTILRFGTPHPVASVVSSPFLAKLRYVV